MSVSITANITGQSADTELALDTNLRVRQIQNAVNQPGTPQLYGYRIKISESNQAVNDGMSNDEARVQYVNYAGDEITGLTPASMKEDGTFDYGGWQHIWFVKNNYPCVVGFDGVERYKVNPNNYLKKLDGTDVVAEGSYNPSTFADGDFMSAIPLCWVKRYTSDGYMYFYVSDQQYDSDFHAYAHTNAKGEIQDYVYRACFDGWQDGQGRLRSVPSIPGTTGTDAIYPWTSSTTDDEYKAALKGRSNDRFGIDYLSLYALLADLATLITKNDNCQVAFGAGNNRKYALYQRQHNDVAPTEAADRFTPIGSLVDKGQFYGTIATSIGHDPGSGKTVAAGSADEAKMLENTYAVKLFHIENLYGQCYMRLLGCIMKNGVGYYKLTPENGGYYTMSGSTYSYDNLGYERIPVTVDPIAAASGETSQPENLPWIWDSQANTWKTGGAGAYIKAEQMTDGGRFPVSTGGGATSCCGDYYYVNQSGTRQAIVGGFSNHGANAGLRSLSLAGPPADSSWAIGAALTLV